MPLKNNGVAKCYKGGLVSENTYLAFFVGAAEVSGGGYERRGPLTADNWTVAGNKVYLSADVQFPKATAAWGAVDTLKLMTADTAGDVLSEWDGKEFSLEDEDGNSLSKVEENNVVVVRGGAADGLSIVIPTG